VVVSRSENSQNGSVNTTLWKTLRVFTRNSRTIHSWLPRQRSARLLRVLVFGLDETLQPKLSGKSSPYYGTLRSLRYAGIVLLAGATLEATAAFALPSDLRLTLMLTNTRLRGRPRLQHRWRVRHNHYRLLLRRFEVADWREARKRLGRMFGSTRRRASARREAHTVCQS